MWSSLSYVSVLSSIGIVLCEDAPSFIEFTSEKGKLYADGSPIYIKGVNWFGTGSQLLIINA
jgi:hypothetical protein